MPKAAASATAASSRAGRALPWTLPETPSSSGPRLPAGRRIFTPPGSTRPPMAARARGSRWGPRSCRAVCPTPEAPMTARVVDTGAGPVVAWLDSSGVTNVYALWFDGTNWDELGGGSAVGNGVSDSTQATGGFSLATDGTNIAVAWTQPSTAAGSSVYVRQYGGSSWSALDGSASGDGISGADASSMPSVAYAGGALYAAWAADTDGRDNIVAAGYAGAAWAPISIQTPASAGVDQVSRGAASDPVLSSGGSSVDLVLDRGPPAGHAGPGRCNLRQSPPERRICLPVAGRFELQRHPRPIHFPLAAPDARPGHGPGGPSIRDVGRRLLRVLAGVHAGRHPGRE